MFQKVAPKDLDRIPEQGIELLNEKVLAGRAANSLARFIELINALDNETQTMPLFELTDFVIKHSGLKAMYEAEKGEKAKSRIENLEELVTAYKQFAAFDEETQMTPLSAFLSHAVLEAGEGQADEFDDAVQLMTLHSAKGLEFPTVFMVGVEEGMFPSQMSLAETGRLEEERRLCYVGMTRAMQKLYICYAQKRRIYGKEAFHKASRFINELPENAIEEVRMRSQVTRSFHDKGRLSNIKREPNFNQTGFNLGQRVEHSIFGVGTIINIEGSGELSKVQVAFNSDSIKWLVIKHAKLKVV